MLKAQRTTDIFSVSNPSKICDIWVCLKMGYIPWHPRNGYSNRKDDEALNFGASIPDHTRPSHFPPVLQESCRAQHPLGILTLLESHDIIGGLTGASDQMSGTAAPAALHLEQMPPEEVVGQHLDPATSPDGDRTGL